MATSTPADLSVIQKILNNSKRQDIPPDYQTALTKVEELTDSFVNAISKAGSSIKGEECTDRAKDYLDSLTNGKFTKIGKSVLDFNALKAFGNLLSKPEFAFEEMICTTVPVVANGIIAIIESVMLLAIKLFKKIDKFRKKLEDAIVFFINEIRNCIIRVITDISRYLADVVHNITSLDALIGLLDSPCGSCIRELLISMMPSKWKKECGDKTGSEFVTCIETQLGITELNEIMAALNQWIQENIIKYIIDAFAKLEEVINYILETIMKPFRYLIKAYCRLLNKPLPAPFIGNPLNECLFVYSTNRKGRYTMSVLQYIDTLKLWNRCFEYICDKLVTDEIKRKIKEFNEELRLNVKYWLGGNELDIYWSCIEMSYLTTDSELKAIWTSLHKDPFREILDFIKNAKKSLSGENPQPEDSIEKDIDPLQDAVTIVNGTDSEMHPIIQGHLKFHSKFTEQSIIKTIQNITGVINYHNYYERLNELMQWEAPYKKSQNHINLLKSSKNRFGVDVNDSIESETLNDFYSILPTYLIRNDYSTLNNIPKPTKLPNEPMIDYYTRWYNTAANPL